jgi:hypothetical protein
MTTLPIGQTGERLEGSRIVLNRTNLCSVLMCGLAFSFAVCGARHLIKCPQSRPQTFTSIALAHGHYAFHPC